MEPLSFLLQAIIAFVAVLTGLSLIFNLQLKPLRENQDRMDQKLSKLTENRHNLDPSRDGYR